MHEDTMRIKVIDTHTAGEPTRIVLNGFPEFTESSLIKQKKIFENNYDHLRKLLLNEPRGHNDMVGAIIQPSTNKEHDLDVIFMDSNRWINMCGHATIAVATVAVEENFVRMVEPVTNVSINTPAGTIETQVYVKNGNVIKVGFENVPSFVFKENLKIEVDGIKVSCDIAYGGSFFVILDITQLHLTIDKENIEALKVIAKKILDTVNKKLKVEHPVLDIKNAVNVEFFQKSSEGQKNMVISYEGQIDRSPCGTGTSAKLATLYQKGQIKFNETFVNESILGTKFQGEVIKTAEIGQYDGIIPKIYGSAYVVSYGIEVLNENDPLKSGFII